jgi:hypothetical protein
LRDYRRRVRRVEAYFAPKERDYEREVSLFARSGQGDAEAWREWSDIIAADKSEERTAAFFRWLHTGLAGRFS